MNTQYPPHFKEWEFLKSGITPQRPPGGLEGELILTRLNCLAWHFERIRTQCGYPIHIDSGYRTPEYNATLPGRKPTSRHTRGLAADFRVDYMNAAEVYDVVLQLIVDRKIPDGGLGLYPGFVHYDIDNAGRRWVG